LDEKECLRRKKETDEEEEEREKETGIQNERKRT
jgi:hypothetical protein